MSIKIENNKLIGTIDDLDKKLKGKLPITREELIVLANSWGRNESFYTKSTTGKTIFIEKIEEKEKYDLSKLNVTKIKDFSYIFAFSNFNGELKWNTISAINFSFMFFNAIKFNKPIKFNSINVVDMTGMLAYAIVFNQELKLNTINVKSMQNMLLYAESFNQELKFNTKNVENMIMMLFKAKSFNKDINFNLKKIKDISYFLAYAENFDSNLNLNLDLDKIEKIEFMFFNTKAFEKKYNNGKEIPTKKNLLKNWIKNNLLNKKNIN